MRTSRRGYLMAMLSGAAIVGAATVGVTTATAHQAGSAAAAVAASAIAGAAASSVAAGEQVGTSEVESSSPATNSSVSPATEGSTGAPLTTTTARSVPAAATTRSASATSPSTTSAPSATAASVPAAKPVYRDGRYSATAGYDSPGGEQELGVTVTLAADVVTAVSLELHATGIAKSYQTLFQTGYQAEVVGKKIDTISLGAVAGSSLTGGGFNEALAQIEAQARG